MPPTVSPFQHIPQSLQHPSQQQQQQQQQQQNGAFYPSLHLYPLNDSFVPKQISLAPQHGRVKIGRQTNAKTVPGERNGYFDSKVLSRQHAEIWEEGGKIYIKDVKSSNGTFINGERLSQEGIESDPFELKTDDTVEFGIDIVGEDNKTIIHHKVAAKVVVVLSPDDLANLPMHHQAGNRRSIGSQLQTNVVQNNALGGMGGAPRQGKSGLTFDHILSRLQTELAKSRETGSELNQLTGAMSDIQDTLGGALPPNLPSYPAALPAVRPPPVDQPAPQPSSSSAPESTAINTIQNQLQDTQSALQQHLDKIRHLESYVNEQETLKREVGLIRDQMEERKREVEILLMQRRRDDDDGMRFSRRRDVDSAEDDDDDDARSVATAMPDREMSDEEDDERQRRREELGRPRTPEPTGHLLDEEYEEERRAAEAASQSQSFVAQETATAPPSSNLSLGNGVSTPSHVDLSQIFSQNAVLANRLETLTTQLESAMELSRNLQNQAMMAQSTIADLEAKVGSLEAFVTEHKEKATVASPSLPPAADIPALEEAAPVVAKSVWEDWREHVEVTWKSERETWTSERERLAHAVKEWESRTTELERKEEERMHREEAAAARSVGFDHDDSASSGEEGDGSSESFQSEGRMPSMVNGFTPKKGKSGRRRKSHVNGITTLPSPHSSPTSSSSFYPTHTRRSTSPTSAEDPDHPSTVHYLEDAKLPISPPNTSPRSRAESLAPPSNEDEDELTPNTASELKSEDGGGLGLMNGSNGPPPPNMMNGNSMVPSADSSFLSSAAAFAQHNNLGANGPTVKQQFGEIVSTLSLSTVFAYLVLVVAVGLSVGTFADLVSLFFFHAPSPSPTLLGLETISAFVRSPGPSAFLSTTHSSFDSFSSSFWTLQPYLHISAATVAIIGLAAWAVVNRERL